MTTPEPVLLDSNVLIALIVREHVHHDRAEDWMRGREGAFATCPITQGSLVRMLVRAGASGDDAAAAVERVSQHPRHVFWPDDVPYHRVDLAGVVGHRQVTDAYLAGLARARKGRLATLDEALVLEHPDVAELLPER